MAADGDLISREPIDAGNRILGGRYELRGELGRGAAGVVWRGEDLFAGGAVAVKSVKRSLLSSEPRLHREIAALRLLRLPGVVTLRDEVTDGDATHLVMDLVDGTEFPGDGRARDWESIAPLIRSMLETLGRVHAAGVVHRDLKPANVLVGDDGRVTLVDFGLSYGPALGGGVTIDGAMVGTPEYLAPEQIRGRGIDGRTDLYALGVMLYEALSGDLPIHVSDFAALLRQKLSGASIPLARVAPDVPREIAAIVDQLLSVDPRDRPQSAGEALRLLFGGGAPSTGEQRVPRLGSREAVESVLAAVTERRSIDVHGGPGSGRSRLLEDAAESAESDGRSVYWVQVGRSPYASLATHIGGFDGLETMSQEDAFEVLDKRFFDALQSGAVFLVDEPQSVDPWSQSAIDRGRSEGSVVRVIEAPTAGCVRLGSLSAQDLRPLFAGPSRILHIPEDAADELWRRTGGVPGNVAAEISAWVRHGFAHWVDGRIEIERTALNRLHDGLPVGGALLSGPRLAALRSGELQELLAWIALAWPYGDFDLLTKVAGRPGWTLQPEIDLLVEEGLLRRLEDGRLQPLALPEVLQTWTDEKREAAHRKLADSLPPGSGGRLRHLASSGDPDEVVAESLALGRRLVTAGKTGDALAAFALGLDAARRANDDRSHDDVLMAYVRACLADGTTGAVNQALYEMGRAPNQAAHLGEMRQFLLAVQESHTGDPARAMKMLDACGPFDDVVLELWRQGIRSNVSGRLPLDRQIAILEEIGEWAERIDSDRARANHRAWTALLYSRQMRHAEAAEMEIAGLEGVTRAPVRMAALLNAAVAFLEAGRLDDCLNAADEAREIARVSRHALYEAYAEAVIRRMHYDAGDVLPPDLEFVEAAAAIGSPWIEAMALSAEAPFARQAGDRNLARSLAERAGTLWAAAGFRAAYMVSRGLQMDCGAPVDQDELSDLLDEAAEEPDHFAVCEFLGLIAPHAGDSLPRVRELLAQAAARVSTAQYEQVRDVISVRGALERAGCD